MGPANIINTLQTNRVFNTFPKLHIRTVTPPGICSRVNFNQRVLVGIGAAMQEQSVPLCRQWRKVGQMLSTHFKAVAEVLTGTTSGT